MDLFLNLEKCDFFKEFSIAHQINSLEFSTRTLNQLRQLQQSSLTKLMGKLHIFDSADDLKFTSNHPIRHSKPLALIGGLYKP